MSTKKRHGIVYSTNPDFKFDVPEQEPETLPPGQQLLYVWLDSKARKGKTVTLVKGFRGSSGELSDLATNLKKNCGAGGSVKDGEIIIQGNFREKIMVFLMGLGYKVKRAGG